MKPSMKRMALSAALVLILAACGGSPAANDAGAEAAGAEPAVPQPAATEAAESEDQADAPGSDAGEVPEPAAGGKTFTIVPEDSEARFIINEILSGNEKTVYGTTTAVEGAISVDYEKPAGVSMSVIRVDLSTLATDNNFRNRALHTAILQTGNDDFRYASFEAAGFSGLPESVVIGQAFNFQISGTLTIHGVSKGVTFEATVTPVSETRLEGLAALVVVYEDFDVRILRLPDQVASVEDTAALELAFVAEAQ